MHRSPTAVATLSLALWILVGSLLLDEPASVSAQDASAAPVAISVATTDASAASLASAAGGTPPLSLGALVGAGVAAVFALKERRENR